MPRNIDDKEFEQHRKNISVYGYTWVKNYMGEEMLSRLRSLVDEHFAQVKDAHYEGRPARDARDLRIYNLQRRDKYFIDVLGAPFMRRMLMELLNDPYYRWIPGDAPNYILQNFNARSSGEALELHIDSRVPAVSDNPWSVQVGFVLNDMTETNGCSVVVAGSHRSGRYTDRDLEDVTRIHAKAGDLVMWDSRTWHGTEENTDGKERWALFASFCMWWMKQDVNMTRSLPEDIYARLSDEQKQLIGYCSIPPESEFQRINLKCGYDFLKPTVADYFNND